MPPFPRTAVVPVATLVGLQTAQGLNRSRGSSGKRRRDMG
jgi:hypothetical protein